MYLRHATRRKDGKTHTYWRLVRSVRLGKRVVQQTVAQLGELDAEGRTRARRLARQTTGRGCQRELFEEPTEPATSVSVRVDRVREEKADSEESEDTNMPRRVPRAKSGGAHLRWAPGHGWVIVKRPRTVWAIIGHGEGGRIYASEDVPRRPRSL
jgi:hypothetical protein